MLLAYSGKRLMRGCSVTQSCLTLCNSVDCSRPGSSVYGILQEGYWSGLPRLGLMNGWGSWVPQVTCTKPHRAGGEGAGWWGRVRGLPAPSVWSGPPSLNHGLLSLCSSHVLGPSAQQANPGVPSWRSLRSSCLSDTSGREKVHICALSARFLPPAPLCTPPAASKYCIVPILPHLDLVLAAYLL